MYRLPQLDKGEAFAANKVYKNIPVQNDTHLHFGYEFHSAIVNNTIKRRH